MNKIQSHPVDLGFYLAFIPPKSIEVILQTAFQSFQDYQYPSESITHIQSAMLTQPPQKFSDIRYTQNLQQTISEMCHNQKYTSIFLKSYVRSLRETLTDSLFQKKTLYNVTDFEEYVLSYIRFTPKYLDAGVLYSSDWWILSKL